MATILLVDDVQLFVELEKSFLEDAGHSVVTAATGEEALEQLERVTPSLLLMDLYLPGIPGDEVCRQLRNSKRWEQLPVIMVTAAGKDEEIRRCLEAGCSDYLTKPVQKKQLLEKVKLLLGTTKARTAVRKRFSAPIQVRTNEKQFIATAHNLSRTGIFLHSSIIPPKESTIELNVRLANERDIVLLGKVKRIQDGPDGGFGVHFIYPGGAGKKDLELLIDEANQTLNQQQDEAMTTETTASAPSSNSEEIMRLHKENESLRQRIEELERENQDFANRIITSEEMNNNMTNLYIAASRLHSVLKRSQVVEIINEVVINLIGAEKFVLALHDKQSQSYAFEAGEGLSPEEFPPVCPGSGLLGRIVANGEHFFRQGSVTEGSDDLQQPLAAIPLTYQNTCIGLLAIYRLFTQKEKFAEVDFQLFRMMAEHAAIALCSSSLYETSERKRQTYQDFMDLLLK